MRKKVEKLVTAVETASITITGVTLLSAKEARMLPNEIRKAKDSWWLRSPGIFEHEAAFVIGEYGDVRDNGIFVSESFGVRPALQFSNLQSSDLQIGDKFIFGDEKYTVISDQYALCDEIVGKCLFRKDWDAEDSNNYEASDVKKFVEKWAKDNEIM